MADLEVVKSHVNNMEGLPNSAIQEEFLTASGVFDLEYMKLITGNRFLSKKQLSALLEEEGIDTFQILEENVNQVLRNEFYEYYEFGRFSNPRQWISHIYWKTGKLLTRKALFKHILS